jgi:phosphoribosylaminoimidazole-succinocarboxamide synthase
MSDTVVMTTEFDELNLLQRGKVRDIYDLGDYLLMVATDRISAYDVVMPDPVPGKGRLLTQISLFWFNEMRDLVPNHVVSAEVEEYPQACRPYGDILRDRSMLVKKAKPLSIECIVRGYISGSGWKSYRETGTVCGIGLPRGLAESDRLPEPIFTPSTKAELGHHDENIDFEKACQLIGRPLAEKVRELSLHIYNRGAEIAEARGIIIADTKFEFGLVGDQLILIDEVLTPDSSRFWPRNAYQPGGPQQSFDKQFLRDHLSATGWGKTPPAPKLPPEVIEGTRSRYEEAYRRLTGNTDDL